MSQKDPVLLPQFNPLLIPKVMQIINLLQRQSLFLLWIVHLLRKVLGQHICPSPCPTPSKESGDERAGVGAG